MNIKNSKICLIGLGYVGLPLAIAFAKKFQVIGYDNNPFRIKELAKSHDRTFEVTNDLLNSVKKNKRLEFKSIKFKIGVSSF